MEEGREPPPESSSSTVAAFLTEVRLESSPAAIGFSDSCPCCGNKKRRCLQPPSSFRKKLLVLDRSPDPIISLPSAAAASISLTSQPLFPPYGSHHLYLCSDPISPMSPPPAAPVTAVSPATPPENSIERSNSSITAEEKAVCCTVAADGKKDVEDGGAAAAEEVRVCVRCRCGVVRRIVLVR